MFFALYVKTENLHWHMSGHTFGTTFSCLMTIRHISRLQRLSDNSAEHVDHLDMLAELREAHNLWDEENDVPTASLQETRMEAAERRFWDESLNIHC